MINLKCYQQKELTVRKAILEIIYFKDLKIIVMIKMQILNHSLPMISLPKTKTKKANAKTKFNFKLVHSSKCKWQNEAKN